MLDARIKGLTHAYLDEKAEGYSNVAAGLLCRAVGHGLKVAYVDVQNSASKFFNFLENLCISHFFVKKFLRLHIETFSFRNGKIQRGILPLVEFFTIDEKIFWNSLNNFDLIIFDNFEFNEDITKYKLINFINSKSPMSEVVFVFSSKKDFKEVKDNFDLVSEYKYSSNKGLLSKKNIINLTGEGKGKSTYSFGYVLRNFINKKDVKLVYFDKGGNFYGEKFFFDNLKNWARSNTFYGKFDYVSTGIARFDGQSFRFENIPADFKEAGDGLMLLKTALRKQTPVIAEELNTTIKTGLLNLNDVMNVLEGTQNELLITGRYSPKQIMDLSSTIIEVIEHKHYIKKGFGVRKGIDF